MGRRDEQRKIKLDILSKIHKRKDLLFGSFSRTLSKEDKRRGWAAVTAHAQSLGVGCGGVSANPNYMRDIWWQNAKKSTMEKLDIAKEPGGAEQVAKRWSVFDDVVLQIIDKEAPFLDLRVDVSRVDSDTDSTYEPADDSRTEDNKKIDDIQDDPLLQGDFDAECDIPVKKEATSSSRPPVERRSAFSKFKSDDKTVAKSKVELEMELLRIQIYKAKLEARQLEMAMFMPPSAHTADIAASSARAHHNDDSCDSFS